MNITYRGLTWPIETEAELLTLVRWLRKAA